MPASFRQQVSEESRRVWDGWRSTDRKEDSLSGTVMQPKRSAAEGDKHDETKRRGIFLLKSAEMKIVCVCNIQG